MEEKLELLACGIIEEVPEGPTSRVSSLVIAPKPDGDVTICIDMRCANQAIIIRERQPIPTVKEVLQDLNGSTVFSCVDLTWGFRQILLPEDSNHVTIIERLRFTFTPNGKREFVPRDQVFPLFFVYCLLLLHKNK